MEDLHHIGITNQSRAVISRFVTLNFSDSSVISDVTTQEFRGLKVFGSC